MSEMLRIENICLGKLPTVSVASRKRPHGLQPSIGMELPNPVGACTTPMYVLDAGHVATQFSLCPATFQFCFGLILPCYSPIPPFLERDVYPILCWKYIIWWGFFTVIGSHS
jgi:hypothetical protein